FEAELDEKIGAVHVEGALLALSAAKLRRGIVGQAQELPELIEHHEPAEGRGQRCDQETVIAPRRRSGNCSRGIAAQPINDEPFAIDEPDHVLGLAAAPRHAVKQSLHDNLIAVISPSWAWGPERRRSLRECASRHRYRGAASRTRRSECLRWTSALPRRSFQAGPGVARARD